MPSQSQEINREFNRRIFINQLKNDRDAAGDRLNRAIIGIAGAFVLVAWVYLIFRMFDALARWGV